MHDLLKSRYQSVRLEGVKATPLVVCDSVISDLQSFLEETALEVNSAGKVLLKTELFDPIWATLNIGSSRSVLTGNYQVKGVGRTLTTDKLDPSMQTGRLQLEKALHSYFVSNLQDEFLPLGSLKGLGVLVTETGHALYVRKADSYRLAQITPDLIQTEKNTIFKNLRKLDPAVDGNILMEKILEQYAASVFQAGTIPSSADNLLIDGKLIDEEEVSWSLNPGSWNFQIEVDWDLCTRGKSPYEIPQEIVEKSKSFFTDLDSMIHHYIRAFSLLGIIVPEAHEWKTRFASLFAGCWSEEHQEHQSLINEILFSAIAPAPATKEVLKIFERYKVPWVSYPTQKKGVFVFNFRIGSDHKYDLTWRNHARKIVLINTDLKIENFRENSRRILDVLMPYKRILNSQKALSAARSRV